MLLFWFCKRIWHFFVKHHVIATVQPSPLLCDWVQQGWGAPGKLKCAAKSRAGALGLGSFQHHRNRQLQVVNFLLLFSFFSHPLSLLCNFRFEPIPCFLDVWICCKRVMEKSSYRIAVVLSPALERLIWAFCGIFCFPLKMLFLEPKDFWECFCFSLTSQWEWSIWPLLAQTNTQKLLFGEVKRKKGVRHTSIFFSIFNAGSLQEKGGCLTEWHGLLWSQAWVGGWSWGS